MADPDQELCDNCHERPATNHICHGGQTGKDRSLCQVCLMQDPEVGSLAQRINEAIRVGHCKYCGAPAKTGSGQSSPMFGEHFDLVCGICAEDLAEFVRQPENNFAKPEFTDEAARQQSMQRITEFMSQREAFMKRKVLERKSKGDT